MNKGGKPKHSYWTEGAFIEKRNDRGRLIAQCKICNKILQNTAINRLKDHRRECRYESSSSLDTPDENHADDDIRNNYESALDDHNYEGPLRKNPKIACKDDRQDHAYVIHERLSVNPQFLQTCNEGAGTSEVNKRQTKVKSFVDNVRNSDRRKIDKALLNFFVAFKLDFKEMESVYFKDFLNVIRPAYAVPNNNHMLNDVLNEAHQKVFTTDSLKSKLVPVLLVLNVDESTIIGLLRNVENKYVYVDVNKCTETNEYELRLNLDMFIRECIKYTYENMKIKIHTVVYNSEVMMSDKISVDLHLGNTETEIFIFQCHTQYIRAIQKFLIRPELITKVNKLLGAFKCIESRIINLGGKNIVLYNSDSWDHYRAALESCSKNLKSMREIVGQSFKVATDILQLIFDDSFEQEIKELIEFSLEIESLKSKVLNIQCNIADAIQYWFQLNESNKNIQYTHILSNILKSVVSPIHLASNYLNPKYKGRVFMENDEYAYTIEEFFVDNLSAEGMGQYTKYVSQTEISSKLFEKNVDDAMMFWTVAERKYGELAKLAQKLLQIPACVPYVNMNKITQNNLTQDQQEKIKCLFYTLKLNESEN